MSTSASGSDIGEARAQQVSVTEDSLVVELVDGRTVTVPVTWYTRLAHGTAAERANWRFIGDGEGIHSADLDEDISVEGLLAGRRSGESSPSLRRLESRTANTALEPAASSVSLLSPNCAAAAQRHAGSMDSGGWIHGSTMTDEITVSRKQTTEILKALDGIIGLLKRLPSTPETAAVMYAIMGNVATIQTNLTGMPRVNPH